MKKVSLSQLAQELGVSKALISLVINNKGDKAGISKATQERVRLKIKELNYQPNLMAKGLRTGKTSLIGLIVPDISNIFYATIAKHIEQLAFAAGYHLVLACSNEDPEHEKQLIKLLRFSQQAEGIILATTLKSPEHLVEIRDQKYPLILIDRKFHDITMDAILVDNENGGYHAAEYLIKRGNENICMLSLTPNHLSSIAEREAGFKRAVKTHLKSSTKSKIVRIPFDRVHGSIAEEFDQLIQEGYMPQGVFAANNLLATAFILYCRERGINIPKQTSLISFDDIEAFKIMHPAISCVAQPLQEIGKSALAMVIEKINNPDKLSSELTLAVNLIERESVK